MTENAKKLIEELKEIMMDYHRSAGNLDDIIRSIETENEKIVDKECRLFFIANQASHRRVTIRYRFENLEKRESDLWNKLLDEVKKES
jgi:hypothetical protein